MCCMGRGNKAEPGTGRAGRIAGTLLLRQGGALELREGERGHRGDGEGHTEEGEEYAGTAEDQQRRDNERCDRIL